MTFCLIRKQTSFTTFYCRIELNKCYKAMGSSLNKLTNMYFFYLYYLFQSPNPHLLIHLILLKQSKKLLTWWAVRPEHLGVTCNKGSCWRSRAPEKLQGWCCTLSLLGQTSPSYGNLRETKHHHHRHHHHQVLHPHFLGLTCQGVTAHQHRRTSCETQMSLLVFIYLQLQPWEK